MNSIHYGFLSPKAACKGMNRHHPANQFVQRTKTLLASVLITVSTVVPAQEQNTDQTPLPVALVNQLNKLSSGPHDGFRANHAKGVMVTGTFTPAASASSISRAPHFLHPVPVTVRFSNGTGVPTLPDASPKASPHGMAIRFDLGDGASTDIVSISASAFPVATPEDFLAMLTAVGASGTDAAKPTPIEKFLASHPAALKFVTTPRPAPESFATLPFYGINAFKFTNSKGESNFIRYRIVPAAGMHSLTDEASAKMSPNYLMEELPSRINIAPVSFTVFAQLANANDNIVDPTVSWSESNPLVQLGTITLTKAITDQVPEQRKILFNPVSLPDGIEPSADPILAIRFPTYAVSYGQRAQ